MRLRNLTPTLLIAVIALIAASATAPAPGFAQSLEEAFKGKVIKISVRGSPGGNSDTYTRLLAPYFVKHLPGKPKARVQNMPGGAGLKMVNFVGTIAPKDGTYMMLVPPFLPMEQALDLNKLSKVDMAKLNWIGNMVSANLFLIIRGPSKTKTIEDARRRVTLLGTPGSAAGISARILASYNNLLGTKFKIIHGYPSGPQMNLAMLKGEIEGRDISNPHLLIQNADPSLGKPPYRLLLQIGLERDKMFPKVPLLSELTEPGPNRQVAEFLSNVVSTARPFAIAGGVPSDRVAAMRKAFKDAMQDPELVKMAERRKVPIGLMEGEKLQKIVQAVVNSPKDVLTIVKAKLTPDKKVMEKRKVVLVKIEGKVSGIKRGGRRIKLSDGKTYRLSGAFTKKLTVAGKKAKRKAIKTGMTCTFMADGTSVIEGACK